MKYVIFACALVTALAEISLPIGYHAAIGIPAASEIKEAESRPVLSRIIEGINSTHLSQHPFFGGLIIGLYNNLVSVCGSSLLSNTRLVTAAHCWDDGVDQAIRFEVVLGSLTLFSGGTRVTTNTVITHPYYNYYLQNDIAIIVIPRIYLSSYIQPINLPQGAFLHNTFVGDLTNIVGYGKTEEAGNIIVGQRLKYSYVYIISNSKCSDTYGNVIKDSNICTDFVGRPCGGDAGGPVYFKTSDQESILIGVMSYTSSFGCDFGDPAVNVRVTSYIDWIESHMG